MPTITQLEYLIAVDKEKHFGKAALACHVSQPSLSAQIQKIEEELEVIIFDRSKKPIIATETGIEIINQAKIILMEHKKLGSIANLGANEPRGSFHLAVIPTLAPYVLPLFIKKFSKEFPKVKLKINEYKTEDIISLLVNDEIDAGLLVTPLDDTRLIERHLFFEPFYAYVSKDHPLANRKILEESDLEHSGIWLLEEGHCFRDQVLKICNMDKKIGVLENVEFASGNLETLKNLVKTNSGYTLLPELAVQQLRQDEVKRYIKKFKKPVPTREVSLVHSRSFLKETVVSALEKVILDCLPNRVRSLKKSDLDVIDLI